MIQEKKTKARTRFIMDYFTPELKEHMDLFNEVANEIESELGIYGFVHETAKQIRYFTILDVLANIALEQFVWVGKNYNKEDLYLCFSFIICRCSGCERKGACFVHGEGIDKATAITDKEEWESYVKGNS